MSQEPVAYLGGETAESDPPALPGEVSQTEHHLSGETAPPGGDTTPASWEPGMIVGDPVTTAVIHSKEWADEEVATDPETLSAEEAERIIRRLTNPIALPRLARATPPTGPCTRARGGRPQARAWFLVLAMIVALLAAGLHLHLRADPDAVPPGVSSSGQTTQDRTQDRYRELTRLLLLSEAKALGVAETPPS